MGFLAIIPFGALAGWFILRIVRRLRRGQYGAQWWRAFQILVVAGTALGVWLSFFMQYQVPNNRLEGFPIPYGISTRPSAGEAFVKSTIPELVIWGARVVDFLFGVALALAPIGVAAFFKDNRGKGDFAGGPQHQPPS